MFEFRKYDNIDVLLNETRIWLDQHYQNYPFKYKIFDSADSEIDCDQGSTIEETINHLESSIPDIFDKEPLVVIRKNKPNENFDISNDEPIIAVIRASTFEKHKEKIEKLGDEFIHRVKKAVLVLDGRIAAISYMEFLFEDSDVCFTSEQINKFESLNQERILDLYNVYQKDCFEHNQDLYSVDDDSKPVEKLKNNLNSI